MNSKRLLKTTIICASVIVMCCCSNNNSVNTNTNTSSVIDDPTEEDNPNLLFRLNFDEQIEKNSCEATINQNAESHGNRLLLESWKHKDSGVLSFNNDDTEIDTSHLRLPTSLLDNDIITISTWVYMPENIEDFNSKSPLFSIEFENGGYFYVSPFDYGTWNSYAIEAHYNQIDKNLTLAPRSKDCYWENTPINGTVQSPAGAWQLIGFTFSDSSLSVYQNGRQLLSFNGNFSLNSNKVTNFLIGTSNYAPNHNFNAKISDFRIYKNELKKVDYEAEYKLTNDDFLTTDWEFNNSLVDSKRNYEATFNGNACFENKDGRDCVSLDGSQVGGTANTKTSLTLPNQTFMGHNEITISTDIYLINSMDRYQRVFEFSTKGGRYFALFIGFSDTNDLKLEFVPHQEKVRHIALEPGYAVPTEQWINITVTANKDKGAIYVNGLLVAESADYAYNPVINYYYKDLTCTIGRTEFYNDKPMSAFVDNFKMYSIALGELDIMKANGIITIESDEEAVKQAANGFAFTYKHSTLLDFAKYGPDGVRQSFKTKNPDIVDNNGRIYPLYEDKDVDIEITFSRGKYAMKKTFKLVVPKCGQFTNVVNDTDLSDVTYDDSYFKETMLSNIDYMFSLDPDRLLYNYRLNAGLDTKGATGYNGWISTSSGGAGQFETQYIGSLARYTRTMPDYVSETAPIETNTPLKRLSYMLNAIRECQIAYGEKYPDQAGYLSAFTHLCIKAIESGTSSVGGGDGIHGTVPVGGVTAWVPFYMYHKNLMMCYDVYKYIEDGELKSLALQMLIDASDWCYNEISSLSSAQRSNVLSFEYGGMTEVMYLTYSITKNPNYLKVARFFEQESLLDNIYNNKNCLSGIHANTTIPKILGAAAAYEVTGDEYYRVIVENFWNMVKSDMCYANGGVSIDEHFETPGTTSQCTYGEETCCSYNMLMVTDYLYRWTGDGNYLDYFENVFYNHIMASIDPASGGKTYPTSTTFGYHKIYSSQIDAFWCCCCTGQESFSKLVYGNYHTDGEYTYVEMYNPTNCIIESGKSISISGNLAADEQVHLSVSKDGVYKLKLRKPSWTNPEVYINGTKLNLSCDAKGYLTINQNLSCSDNIVIKLPMKARLEQQKGVSKSYALFYGPFMCVCDLGIQEGDIYLSTNQTGTYSNGRFISYDGAYQGNLTQLICISDFNADKINDYIQKNIVDDKLVITLEADNETVTFIPFMNAIYNRFSMYMYYFDSSSSGDYEIENGDVVHIDTSNPALFTSCKEQSGQTTNFGSNGLFLSGGEQKVIYNKTSLKGNYEVGFKMSGTGSLYGGLYLGASSPNDALDMINALNVNFERDPGTGTFRIMIYQFRQAYLGCISSAYYYSNKNEISVRVVVKNGFLYVFTDNEIVPRLNVRVDSSWTDGMFGIRNQGSSTATYSDIYYKQERY